MQINLNYQKLQKKKLPYNNQTKAYDRKKYLPVMSKKNRSYSYRFLDKNPNKIFCEKQNTYLLCCNLIKVTQETKVHEKILILFFF